MKKIPQCEKLIRFLPGTRKHTQTSEMILPIRCMNCGKLLADKWDYYQRRLRELKGPGYAEPICFDGKTIPNTAEAQVYQELGLKRYCCKKTLLTHVDLIEKI